MAGSSIDGHIKSGYWTSWQLQTDVQKIDTSLYTHVYYAFAIPKSGSYELDLTGDCAPHRLLYFTETLRTKKPDIKILLSIGGGLLPNPNVFAEMASNDGHRRKFINSAILAARDHGFDGLDLDWEYPQTVKEMNDMATLLREWRAAIISEAGWKKPHLLLTAAVRYTPVINYPADRIRLYPVKTMAQTLDWINVMAYDHHGQWEQETGAHTDINITRGGITKWIQEGMPKYKLVLGLAMYGKVWNLKNPNVNGIGAPAVAPVANAGNRDPTIMGYSDIINFIRTRRPTVVQDEASWSVYTYGDGKWIGYDDEGTIKRKVKYAKQLELRGYFFWEIAQDSHLALARAASGAWNS